MLINFISLLDKEIMELVMIRKSQDFGHKIRKFTIRFLAIFNLLPLFQFFVLNSETLHMNSLIDTL